MKMWRRIVNSGKNLLEVSWNKGGSGDAIWAEVKKSPGETLVCVSRESLPPKDSPLSTNIIPAEPECVEIR